MNNGKVRIYDLSKELNLENKDLLEICDQLGIPVKTHSSSITEGQASQIRNEAKKLVANRPSSPANSRSNRPQKPQKPKPQKPKPQKPQIRALHHRKERPVKQETNADSGTVSVRTPSLNKPTAPTNASGPRLSSPPGTNQPLPTSSSVQTSGSVEGRSSSGNRSTQEKSASSLVTPTRLAGPPVRSPGTSSRSTGAESPRPSSPKSEPAQPIVELVSPVKEDGRPQKKLTQPSPTIQLLGPPSKRQPKTDASGSSVIPANEPESRDGDDEIFDTVEKLQRPRLKRPSMPTRTPAWEEEVAETPAKAKTAKAARTKRRTFLVEDDDEDLSEGVTASASQAAAATNLSLARPPKPKHMASTTQPTPKSSSSGSSGRKRNSRSDRYRSSKPDNQPAIETPPEKIELPVSLTVQQLANLIKIPETQIITQLFVKGIAVNITQNLDQATARLVAEEMGIQVESKVDETSAAKETEMLDLDDLDNLSSRPPVVTIMGHVDHGKTTLLDSIRQTKVAQGEAGGITQHIGAYHVDVGYEGKERQIVFLDTPGHEAFTAMRARGTRVTDIAVLVVAADDGVRPQTKEAISHARAAEVPIVVAINKIDKEGANSDRVKQELAELNLLPEEWGGDTVMVPVSALTGENLDSLLENICIVAELEELSANPDRSARGTVIEANLDRTRGPIATLLVQNGTLRVGDVIVVGPVFGKIRAMVDDRGDRVEAASPSFAVEILGLNDVPAAGDEFEVYPTEKEARTVAEGRAIENRDDRLLQMSSGRRITLSSLSAQAEEGELKELNIILKADVQGSIEAILGSLQQLPQGEVQLRVLMSAPGEVTETDVDLAAASGAVLVGFNTTLASGTRAAADSEGVDIRQYEVIYKLLDDIQGAMEGLLDPEEVEESLGSAEVRATFPVGRGVVAGCYVLSGKLVRNRQMRVVRGGKVVFTGTLDSLKRVKDDVKEVASGFECGINSDKFNDWQEGDIIEAYEMAFRRRKLAMA
ncbi:MAG: translation initiation factor IF-2 [Cyanobacteria bacterium P01_H01_bin.15]